MTIVEDFGDSGSTDIHRFVACDSIVLVFLLLDEVGPWIRVVVLWLVASTGKYTRWAATTLATSADSNKADKKLNSL